MCSPVAWAPSRERPRARSEASPVSVVGSIWVTAVLAGLALMLCLRPELPGSLRATSLSPRPGLALGRLRPGMRRRRRRERTARAERALEACAVMADELRAGRSPEAALSLAARWCPELLPVVAAQELGADVPTALSRTGLEEMRFVGAAWQVSSRSGRGLGEALTRVVAGLRASRVTQRVVASELASARATARLLVALPALALLGGAAGGGRPWGFFFSSVVGHLCLGLGLTLAWGGLRWIDFIADDVERSA